VKVQNEFKNEEISTVDGVKIDFAENWVHLRKSNTEPIIRIYTEAFSQEEADKLRRYDCENQKFDIKYFY
jgi:phosphomannomutase